MYCTQQEKLNRREVREKSKCSIRRQRARELQRAGAQPRRDRCSDRAVGKKQQLTFTSGYYKGNGREGGRDEEQRRQEVTVQRNRNCTLLVGVRSKDRCLQKLNRI